MQKFLTTYKVTIFGCLMAALMVFQQFELQGPVDLKVVGLAALVAVIGFLANNLRGQAATILASMLPSLGVIATAAQNHAPISWAQTGTSAAIAIIGVFLPPMKNLSYEQAPTIVAAKNIAPKLILILVIVLAAFQSHGQSPFKKQPNLSAPVHNFFARAVVAQNDSIVNSWRFTASISPFTFTLGGGGYGASAGSEYGYKHQSYSYTAQSYTTLYSINAAWVPIVSSDSIRGIGDIAHFAILGGFDDDLIQVGPMWNPNNPKGQKWGVMLALGIKL